MKRFFLLIMSLGLFPLFNYSLAQTPTIANTSLELKDNLVHISYDILYSNNTELFNIGVEVTDSAGNVIETKSFNGDIGENIRGGSNKRIVWDPEADRVLVSSEINIQVYADIVLSPPLEPLSDGSEGDRGMSRGWIIAQSIAFPGLGLSRTTGKPHWIKGAAGYACIVGSKVFNRMASTSLESYKDAESPSEANALFMKSVKQNSLSRTFAFTAIAVWVTDLTWTVLGTSGMNRGREMGHLNQMTLGSGYDVISGVPLLSLRYEF